MLVVTSVAMQWTVRAARRGDMRRCADGLLAGGVLTFAFLAGQLWSWQQLSDAGYYLAANPANGSSTC